MKSSTLDYMDCIPQVSYAKISYEKDFRIAFLESKGDEFQRLFEKLMKKVYPNDFTKLKSTQKKIIFLTWEEQIGRAHV